MAELKTCPFCLEEIPVRAIKCRYCESMVDDVKPTESEAPVIVKSEIKDKKKRRSINPQQGGYYQPGAGTAKGSRFLIPLIIVLALVLILGAGAGYWFLLRGDDASATGGAANGDVIGSWRGGSAGNEIYFQFLPNEMINIAVTPEGYWFRTQYRLVETEEKSYLELYHRGLAEWDRSAELSFIDADTLIMTDTWDGIVIRLESIADSEFREAISELRFER